MLLGGTRGLRASGTSGGSRGKQHPWAQAVLPTPQPHAQEDDGYRPGGQEDQAPTWNFKDPKLHTYLRKIELCCFYDRAPANKRGIRLLAGSEGDAFDKMKLVMPDELDRPDRVS